MSESAARDEIVLLPDDADTRGGRHDGSPAVAAPPRRWIVAPGEQFPGARETRRPPAWWLDEDPPSGTELIA